MNIRELLIKLRFDGDPVIDEIDEIDERVDKVKANFLSLGTIIGALGAAGIIKGIIETADAMQTLQNRLGGMATASSDSFADLEEVNRHAQEARMSLEDYTHVLTGIGAATHELVHSQGDLLDITDTLAKGLKLAGANGQVTTGIINQMVQALAIGKLQWEDTKVIVQQSDQFAGQLAKGMGMTLNEMIAATQGKGGGISAAKVIEGIRNMRINTMKEFAKLPMGWADSLTIMGDRWDMFIARINHQTMFVSRIANWFLELSDVIEKVVTNAIDQLGGLDKALVHIARVATPLAILLGVIKGFQILSALLTPAGAIIALGTAIGLLYDDYLTWKEGGDSFLDWAQWKGEIDGAVNGLKDLRDILSNLLGIDFANWTLKGEFNDLKKNISDLVTMCNTLADVLNKLAAGDFTGAYDSAKKLMSQKGNPELANATLPGMEQGKSGAQTAYEKGNEWLNSVLPEWMGGARAAGPNIPTPADLPQNAAGVKPQPTAQSVQITAPVTATITVVQQPGENADALATRVVDGFQKMQAPAFDPNSLILTGGAK